MQEQLKKEIGLFGGVSILLGIMVGSGIFFIGSYVLYRLEMSLGLALLAWVIGGIITLFSGLTYAELGAMYPETGGYYVYLREGYGRPVAFLSGFMNFMLTSSGSIAALSFAFAFILSFIVPLNTLQMKLIAAFVIVLLSGLNFFGVKTGERVQKLFLIAKLIPIVGLMVMGLFLGKEPVDLSLTPTNPVSMMKLLSMIGLGVIATFWAYEGWTNLNTVTGEMKNVKRNLPLALLIAAISATVLYTLFNYAIFRVLGQANIIDQLTNPAGANIYLGTASAMTMIGNIGQTFVIVTMLIAVFGAVNGVILVFPRVYYAMSKDGLFLPAFSSVHPKYHTPYIAIIGSGIMGIVLLIFDLESLITMVAFGGLIFNTLIFFSLFIFRYKYPQKARPYRVWGYPFVPLFAIISMLVLLYVTFTQDIQSALIGSAVVLLGLPFYYLFMQLGKKA